MGRGCKGKGVKGSRTLLPFVRVFEFTHIVTTLCVVIRAHACSPLLSQFGVLGLLLEIYHASYDYSNSHGLALHLETLTKDLRLSVLAARKVLAARGILLRG